MLPKTFDSLEKGNIDVDFGSKKEVELKSNKKSKDDFASENIPDLEKAENALWLGIKSEKAGDLELAASYYRLAIKYNPECDKGYRLLSDVLKKSRKNRNKRLVKINSKQPKDIASDKDLIVSAQAVEDKADNNFEEKGIAMTNTPASNISNSIGSEKSKFSAINLVPLNVNLNVNNTDSSSQKNSEIVLLPNMETSPAGDLVLQDNLAVSQLYVEQASVFFEQKQWEKSIAACQEALRICPSVGEAYKIWGNCLQQSGKSADAIGIYAKALELQPNMAEVYCNLGSIYAKSKKWQQAIDYYQKAAIIDSKCAAAYRNLARVWDELGEYDKSEGCFFKALAVKPELISAKNHFDLAHNLLAENKIDKAIACYKNCIYLEPKFFNAYVRLAQLLEEEGKTEEALYYYKKLAQLQIEVKNQENKSKSRQQIHDLLFGKKDKSKSKTLLNAPIVMEGKKAPKPKNITQLSPGKTPSKEDRIAQYVQKAQQQPNSDLVQFELGNLYVQTGQWQNAITSYLKAIRLAPHQTKYYLSMGKAWEKLGDTVKANQSFYQAFSLEPEKVKAKNHLLLGNKLLEQRQIKSAIACYRRAITQDPRLIESYLQLGKILLSGGNYQGAIACYRQAIKADPQNSLGYFYLGNVYTQTKQESAAIDCYQKAAAIDTDNADIRHNLGEVFFKTENWLDAAEAYRKAIALNPNNSWSYNNLGDALLKLEQWQEAADSLRQAIKIKPDFVWSHYNLGEALAELEQWDEALTSYQLAKELDSQLPRVKQKIARILRRRSKSSQQEAIAFCKAQIQEDPDNIELYHQAISLDRKNYQLYLGLGKALAKQEKVDEAISIFQMGLEIQPEDRELSSELGKAIQAKNPHLNSDDVAEKVAGLKKSY